MIIRQFLLNPSLPHYLAKVNTVMMACNSNKNNIYIDNPAFDYDKAGDGSSNNYGLHRQTDPRIAKFVWDALEGAKSVLNVGAGAGSYEPKEEDCMEVVAVEPSASQRAERLKHGKSPAIVAKADSLPFENNRFDASMAMVTVHHWPDITKGLQEMRRVTRNQILVLTFDPEALDEFTWIADYFPELIEVESQRMPTIPTITSALGGEDCCQVIPIPIPMDCKDGFQEAFYARPEAVLDASVRRNQSAWGFVPEALLQKRLDVFSKALKSGEWEEKYGNYRTLPTFTGALRLIVARPS